KGPEEIIMLFRHKPNGGMAEKKGKLIFREGTGFKGQKIGTAERFEGYFTIQRKGAKHGNEFTTA
ncbi:MAG: hypothetical protein ABTA22_00725, partial [Clostridia bacterium]